MRGEAAAPEVLIGVTGGIAAYKSCELVSRLRQRGYGVSVVMTRAATQFVSPTTFESLSGRPVAYNMFSKQRGGTGAHPHIDLARHASLLCIAPATANIIAKAAHGLADDLLSTLFLAFDGTRIVAPAMNAAMWQHPAVQRNVQQIQIDGAIIVPPETGRLACGDIGTGRMASPETILQQIEKLLPLSACPESQ